MWNDCIDEVFEGDLRNLLWDGLFWWSFVVLSVFVVGVFCELDLLCRSVGVFV